MWPEQKERRARLCLALDIAAQEKPYLIGGNLPGPDLDALCHQAPKDATLVIFHTTVLAYDLHEGAA